MSKYTRVNFSKFISQILIFYLLVFSIFFSCIVSSDALGGSDEKTITNGSEGNSLGNGVFEIVNDPRDNLTEIGYWNENFGYPDSFYIDNDKVYVKCDGDRLFVFNISDKLYLKVLQIFDLPVDNRDFIVKDDHAFVILDDWSLEVLYLSPSNQTEIINHIGAPPYFQSLAISENILYVTSSYGDIFIYNISSPEQFDHINTIEFLVDKPKEIKVTNTTLYCSLTEEVFKVFNVSDLTNITLLDTFTIEIWLYFTTFSQADNLIYLGISDNGIIVLNATDLTNLTEITRFYTGYFYSSFAIQNSILFGMDTYSEVHLWDFTNISAPIIYKKVEFENQLLYQSYFQLVDNLLVITTINYLYYYNITDLLNWEKLSEFCFGGIVTDVVIQDNFAYVSNFYLGLEIIDISNKTAPKKIGQNKEVNTSQKLVIEDNYLYIVDWLRGIAIIDVSDPTNPVVIGYYLSNNSYLTIQDLFVADSFLYLAGSIGGLEIIDVSNPFHPQLAGTYMGNYAIFDVIVDENTAYLATYNNNLVSLDITDKTRPQVMAEKSEMGWYTYDLTLYNGFIYLAGINYDGIAGFLIYKLKNPPIIDFVGVYISNNSNFDDYSDIVVHHDFVYLSNYRHGLEVVDCTKKTAPILKDSYFELSDYCFDLIIYDDFLYVACGSDGLRIFLPLTGSDNNWVLGFTIFASVLVVTVIVVLVVMNFKRKRKM